LKTDHFHLTQDEILSFRVKPFEHQVEGVNFGLDRENGKWLLLDSMGTGKSLTIMTYAETLKKRGLIDHCMIICGVDSLRQNWKREIQKFSNESCMVLGEKISRTGKISYEPVKKRVEILKNPIQEFFVIVNVATLRSDEFIEAFKKSSNKFGLIAVDEIHRIATKTSAQGANLLKLKADYKIGATGSLVTNSPLSCYVPLSFTENDKATLTTYKSQYCEFGGFGGNQVVGYKNLATLQEEIQDCSIRRTLDQVRADMPSKFINYETLEMNDAHRKFYEAIKDGVKEEADRVDLKAANLLALTTRLRQATAEPSILTTQEIPSTKVERAVELVEDLVAQGEKVVVFSNFKEPVYQLAKLLAKYEPLINTGDQDDTLVGRQVDLFQEDPRYKVFLGTHGKCGTGWTLNAASYAIFLDTPWTDASLSQSTDRIWRVTNTRPAIITILTCMDTIDERVREIVETKKELADYLVDGKENNISISLQNEMRNILRSL
jgi:SNF2 family DNA or RNA helicase